MNATSKEEPGLWLLGIGGITLILGLMVTVYGLANFIGFIVGSGDDIQRAKAPGQATVMVETPGRILIYQEWRESAGRETRETGNALRKAMTCVLRDPNGQEISVVPVQSAEQYMIGDIKGVSVWEFQAPASGKYTLDIQASGNAQRTFDLTIGPSRLVGSLKQFGMSLVALIGGGIIDMLGLVLVIIGVLKRSRFKRQHQQEPAGEA